MLRQIVYFANYGRVVSAPRSFVGNPSIRSQDLHTTSAFFKKAKRKQPSHPMESDDEEDSEFESPEVQDKHSKVMDLKVSNLRLDSILKAGLGMARNKVETSFYESKIRLNGAKVYKKSEAVREGDEIDLIKGPSPSNPNLLTVARVEVLRIVAQEDNITLKLRRCKSLLIENYKDTKTSE